MDCGLDGGELGKSCTLPPLKNEDMGRLSAFTPGPQPFRSAALHARNAVAETLWASNLHAKAVEILAFLSGLEEGAT